MSDCSVESMKPKARRLRECPFCQDYAIMRVDLNGLFFAKCRGCGATSRHFRDPRDAERAWNRRRSDDDLK